MINTFVYTVWNVEYIFTAGKEAAQTSGIILVILSGAGLFSWIMSIEQMDELFAGFLFLLSGDTVIALLVANVIILVIGLFLEPIAALIMLVPVIVPPLVEAGVHPVHLGIIVIFNLMIGLLTPPLGLSLFVTSDIADMPPEEVIGELKIFYVLLLTILLIVTFIHEISLFFPELVR